MFAIFGVLCRGKSSFRENNGIKYRQTYKMHCRMRKGLRSSFLDVLIGKTAGRRWNLRHRRNACFDEKCPYHVQDWRTNFAKYEKDTVKSSVSFWGTRRLDSKTPRLPTFRRGFVLSYHKILSSFKGKRSYPPWLTVAEVNTFHKHVGKILTILHKTATEKAIDKLLASTRSLC